MRHLVLFILLTLISFISVSDEAFYEDIPPIKSIFLKNYSENSAIKYFEEAPIQPLEGIWHYPDEGVKLAIEHFESPQFSSKFKYRLVLISADDHSLLPGTVMGYITDSAQNNKFYIWIYSLKSGSTLLHPQRCVAQLINDNSVITFQTPEIKVKLRINVSRFLPTLFKGIGISVERTEEKLPHGFKRVYPSYDSNGSVSSKIRYL